MRRVAAWLLCLGSPALGCTVARRAELPVRFEAGFALVPATVGGEPAALVLDTGSADMLVTPGAAARLHLAPDPARRTRVLGTGGASDVPNVVMARLDLGGAAIPPRSVPMEALPPVVPADGLLGTAVLERFDVELDLVIGVVRLWSLRDCPLDRVAMPVPFTAVPLQIVNGAPRIPVVVNGVTLSAVLDSGSRTTLLRPEAATRVGAVLAGRGGVATGVGGQAIAATEMQVRSLSVGYDVTREMTVAVAPLDISGADMLLGLDWLRPRRSWVGYAAGRFVVALPHAWR